MKVHTIEVERTCSCCVINMKTVLWSSTFGKCHHSDRGLLQSYEKEEVPGRHQSRHPSTLGLRALDDRPQENWNSHSLSFQIRAALETLRLCECPYILRLSPSNMELFYWTLCCATSHRPTTSSMSRAGYIRISQAGFIWSMGTEIVAT